MRIFFDLFRTPTLAEAVQQGLRFSELELLQAEQDLEKAKCVHAYRHAVTLRLRARAVAIVTPATLVVSPCPSSSRAGADIPAAARVPLETDIPPMFPKEPQS